MPFVAFAIGRPVVVRRALDIVVVTLCRAVMVRNDELDGKLVELPDPDKSAEEELDVPFAYVTVQGRLAHSNRLTISPDQGRYRRTIADGFAKPKRENDCQRMQYRTSGHGRRL